MTMIHLLSRGSLAVLVSILMAIAGTGRAEAQHGHHGGGHGFGHGVGMSQWGAQLHAVRGYSAREIVTFYYDSTDLVDMASGAVQKQ